MSSFETLIPRSPFVGRQAVLKNLSATLKRETCRLLTVWGPGGIGKSRLVQEFLHSSDLTATWLSLAEFKGSAEFSLLKQITRIADLPSDKKDKKHNILSSHFEVPVFLVLDSFEHLRHHAPQINDILKKHPSLKIIATSRAPLLLKEEFLFSLSPLSLENSVKIFLGSALSVRPQLQSTPDNHETFEKICRGLDGNPLALELASARLRHLGLPELARELKTSLTLLSSGGADSASRHQTFANNLLWSYQLLKPSECALLSRLVVFHQGFEQSAAAAVSPDTSLEDLLCLVDQSLLSITHSSTGETRYTLPHTTRLWLESRSQNTVQPKELSLIHARHYLQLAGELASFRGSQGHALALKRLSEERGNFTQALESFQASKLWSESLQLAGHLGWFWEAYSLLAEGRSFLESSLQVKNTLSDAAEVHYWLSILLRHQGDYDEALIHGKQAISLQRDQTKNAEIYNSLGQIFFRQGDYQRSREHFQTALELSEAARTMQGKVNALNGLGRVAWVTNRVKEGIDFEHMSLSLAQEQNYPLGEAWAHNALGEIHRNLQEPQAAAIHLKRASEGFGRLHEYSLAALTLQNLAYVELSLKRWDEAEKGFREALKLWRRAGARHGLALCLVGLAGVLSAQKRDKLGANFLGAADRLLETIQVRLEASDHKDYAQIQSSLRSRLGENFKDEHWVGRQTSPNELLQFLNAKSNHRNLMGLTPREREVLQCAATGASNKEVAETLVISPQTVMVHLRSVYRKINVTSRTAASRWAAENGLVE